MLGVVKLADPDEEVRVEVDARDRLAFEKVGRKEAGLPQNGPLADAIAWAPETYGIWLCWHASARLHGPNGSFTQFQGRVTGVTLEMSEQEARASGLGNPTSPAASAG